MPNSKKQFYTKTGQKFKGSPNKQFYMSQGGSYENFMDSTITPIKNENVPILPKKSPKGNSMHIPIQKKDKFIEQVVKDPRAHTKTPSAVINCTDTSYTVDSRLLDLTDYPNKHTNSQTIQRRLDVYSNYNNMPF